MPHRLQIVVGLVLAAALAGVFYYWAGNRRDALAPDKSGALGGGNNASSSAVSPLELTLPAGFSISALAGEVPGARVMVMDSFGNLWVSQTSQGTISTVEMADDGSVKGVYEVFRNMKNPHGLALDPIRPLTLFIAEEDKISKVGLYSDSPVEKVADLPAGGRHTTRSLQFSPDGKLYASIGSSCDVCYETDQKRAKIFLLETDSGDLVEFARGLRNAVFMAFHPKTGELWATEMGRDHLGDNLPPDEVNIVEEGKNYGWPICYGRNIHDANFDKNTYIRNPCLLPHEMPSLIDLQAHSAPLGLAFIPEEGWPEEYQNDLLVAYHGSWNRSEPTGYKIVRFKLNADGKPEGGEFKAEDFITGWLNKNGNVQGRPVGLLALPGGILYISDDYAGRIYKAEYASDNRGG